LRVVVLDTETTGLDAGKDKIIELAMLRFEVDLASGQPVGEVQVFDELEDPGMPIPPEVQALTGIRDADVAGKRLDAQRVAYMLDGVDLVIAHNAGFDRPFCEARFAVFQDIAWACSFADMDWKVQGRSSQKLESLARTWATRTSACSSTARAARLRPTATSPSSSSNASPTAAAGRSSTSIVRCTKT
jgi:DNA polymerase-3 subunit epsilon